MGDQTYATSIMNNSEELKEKLNNFGLKDSICDDFEEFERKIDIVSAQVELIMSGGVDGATVDDNMHEIPVQVQNWNQLDPNPNERKPRQVPLSSTVKKSRPVNKTSINNSPTAVRPCAANEFTNESMSQEAFMKAVEADVNKRQRERRERNAKASKLMTEANDAFRSIRYEKALCLFNKAIDERRDSSLLYTNRALTYLKLGLFSKACADCDTALKLKEWLKPRLYKGRALYEMAEEEAARVWMDETKQLYAKRTQSIEEYMSEWCTEK